jgi:hypothetical protein
MNKNKTVSVEYFHQSKRMAHFREAVETLRRVGVRSEMVALVNTVGQNDVALGMGIIVDDLPVIPKDWFDKGMKLMPRWDGRNLCKPQSILDEAARIRGGERNADYGDAVESFEIIAQVANAITGLELTPTQCCKVMLAVKLTRERYNHKRDNLVDLCGYADILELIETRKIDGDEK